MVELRTVRKKNEVLEKFFDTEDQLHLLERRINGVFFWKLIRADVFKVLFSSNSGIRVSKPNVRFLRNALENLRVALLSLNSGMFRSTKVIDMLIIESPRKARLLDQSLVDPYTFFFREKYCSDKNVEVLSEQPSPTWDFSLRKVRTLCLFSFYYDFLYRGAYKFLRIPRLAYSDAAMLEDVSDVLGSQFHSCPDLRQMTISALRNFMVDYTKFRKYLELKSVKQIVFVCSYGKEGITAAAQSLGIEVIELQHGWIGYGHPGYSFPKSRRAPYFPNKLYVFGDFWKSECFLPLQPSNVVTAGYPFLNYMRNALLNRNHEPARERTVLVTSQPSVGKLLFYETLKLAALNPDYFFIYRLHPKEGSPDAYLEALGATEQVNKLGNMHMSASYSENIYQALAKSEFLFSVSSTTLFEALVFGVKPVILNVDPLERMYYLASEGLAELVNLQQDVDFSRVKNNLKTEFNIDYYFAG